MFISSTCSHITEIIHSNSAEVHVTAFPVGANVTKLLLVSILSKGKTTIDNGIAVLREEGYMIRVGSNKTGYWKVLEPDE